MGENYVIFIAPINKWNPISRADKVRFLVNQSISLIYLRFIRFPSASDRRFKLQWLSACVALITSWTSWTCLCRSGSFSRGQFYCYSQRMFSKDFERRKKASSFNTANLRYHGEAALRDFKQPPLLERSYCTFVTSAATSWHCTVTVYYGKTAALL